MATVTYSVGTGVSGSVLGALHFGANYLFNRLQLGDAIGDQGAYDEAALALGVRHLRYPGGTVTERQFSLMDPDNTLQTVSLVDGAPIANTNQHSLTPLSAFLAEAARLGAKVTLVLPTAQYAEDMESALGRAAAEAEIKAFVQSVLQGPHGHLIEAFELGNEYAAWFDSPAAYGRVAGPMAEWVQAAVDAAAPQAQPLIAIQASARAARLDESRQIVDTLSDQALAAIDAVVIHNYRPEPWAQTGTTASKFAHVPLFEAAAQKPLLTLLTEYNVANGAPALGMAQGAGVLAMIHDHATLGADLSHIWPLRENNNSALTGGTAESIALGAGGAVLRQAAQSLAGMQALNDPLEQDLNGDGTVDVLIYGFQTPDLARQTLFVASLSDQSLSATLDLGAVAAVAQPYDYLWLTETTPPAGADPTAATLVPDQVQRADHGRLDDAGGQQALTVVLNPYQITRVELASAAADGLWGDAPGETLFKGTAAAEIVLLQPNTGRVAIKDFDLGLDRIDVSALGVTSLEDLEITPLVRRDGSVGWIDIATAQGGSAAVVRLDPRFDMRTDTLTEDSFLFAMDGGAMARLAQIGTSGSDILRGQAAAERFVLQADGVRDIVREFDDGTDLIDISAWGLVGFEALDIANAVRRDGSVGWVVVEADAAGEVLLVRMDAVGETSASRLTADDFIL